MVQVAYGTDVRALKGKIEAAVARVPRVLEDPGPTCQLAEFASDGINLKIFFWINDPESGQGNVRSDVNFALLDLFAAEGVEIPFPQRVLHQLAPPPGAGDKPARGQPGCRNRRGVNTHGLLVALALLAGCATGERRAAPADGPRTDAAPEAASGFNERRGTWSSTFMVAAANPLATEAGQRMLKAGGSAVDAAIAVQMVLTLVEPQSLGHWRRAVPDALGRAPRAGLRRPAKRRPPRRRRSCS